MIAEQLRCLSRHDLGGQGRCGEGTAVLEHGGRRYLYLAHEQPPANFSVLDVTDPRAPRLLTQTRLPHGGVRSNSLAVGDGLLLVAYQVQAPGQQPAGIEVFDLSRPAEPRLAGRLDLSGPRSRGTHWVGYTGGRYAYLSTGTPDSRPRDPRDDQFPVIVDLTRPDRPTEAGRWWLPGTQDGDGAPPPARHERWDAGFRAHNINLHSERQHRAYVGYLDAGAIVLDTTDVAAPRLVARLDYHPPLAGFTHTVLPLPGRDLLVISDESVHDIATDQPRVWLADASDERARDHRQPAAAAGGRVRRPAAGSVRTPARTSVSVAATSDIAVFTPGYARSHRDGRSGDRAAAASTSWSTQAQDERPPP